jgi:xylan 1,4-beta-xylosidase
LDMGRPAKLTDAQLQKLQALTADAPIVSSIRVHADGTGRLDLPMRDHDVVLVELSAS